MDVTRVPALPPAKEGSPDAASVIREARRSAAAFAHYADGDPGLEPWQTRERVLLREIDRIAADRDRYRALLEIVVERANQNQDVHMLVGFWDSVIAIEVELGSRRDDISRSIASKVVASLAPRPAAPAEEGGGA